MEDGRANNLRLTIKECRRLLKESMRPHDRDALRQLLAEVEAELAKVKSQREAK